MEPKYFAEEVMNDTPCSSSDKVIGFLGDVLDWMMSRNQNKQQEVYPPQN